jgi:hypothetical protein
MRAVRARRRRRRPWWSPPLSRLGAARLVRVPTLLGGAQAKPARAEITVAGEIRPNKERKELGMLGGTLTVEQRRGYGNNGSAYARRSPEKRRSRLVPAALACRERAPRPPFVNLFADAWQQGCGGIVARQYGLERHAVIRDFYDVKMYSQIFSAVRALTQSASPAFESPESDRSRDPIGSHVPTTASAFAANETSSTAAIKCCRNQRVVINRPCCVLSAVRRIKPVTAPVPFLTNESRWSSVFARKSFSLAATKATTPSP